jgi:hypothetical protein
VRVVYVLLLRLLRLLLLRLLLRLRLLRLLLLRLLLRRHHSSGELVAECLQALGAMASYDPNLGPRQSARAAASFGACDFGERALPRPGMPKFLAAWCVFVRACRG